jgi:hypothetical protein
MKMSGTKMVFLLCGLTIFLLPSHSFGESYECPKGKVVTGESTSTDLLSKCGTPHYVDKKMKDTDMIDLLGYKMDGGRRTSVVTFTLVNGKLAKISQDIR